MHSVFIQGLVEINASEKVPVPELVWFHDQILLLCPLNIRRTSELRCVTPGNRVNLTSLQQSLNIQFNSHHNEWFGFAFEKIISFHTHTQQSTYAYARQSSTNIITQWLNVRLPFSLFQSRRAHTHRANTDHNKLAVSPCRSRVFFFLYQPT